MQSAARPGFGAPCCEAVVAVWIVDCLGNGLFDTAGVDVGARIGAGIEPVERSSDQRRIIFLEIDHATLCLDPVVAVGSSEELALADHRSVCPE